MGTLTIEGRDGTTSYSEGYMAENWTFDTENQMLIYKWGGNSDSANEEVKSPNVIFHTPIGESANLAGVIDAKGKAHTLMPGKGMRVIFPDGVKRNIVHHR